MSARLRKLLEQRNRIVARSREIIEGAEKEGRAMSDEEQRNFDAAMNEQAALQKTIESAQRQAELEGEMARSNGSQLGGDEGRSGREDGREPDGRGGQNPGTIGEGRYAINIAELREEDRPGVERRASSEFNARFRREFRAALDASSTGASGSYLITPLQVAQGFLQRLDDLVFIRSQATVYTLPSATSLGRVSLETDAEDADWSPELSTGGQEDSLAFGRRDLSPHPLAKYAKISNKLLRIATIDPMGVLMSRLAYKMGVTEEKGFLLGNGVQKPLGVYVASNDGIPTSRDVATGNTSTSPTFEGLISAKYSLKAGYLKNANWMFHRDGVSKLAKLRDDSGAGAGTGQFLWQPSTQLGQPDRVLGIPVQMSEFNPNTFTTGQYVGIIGDFSFYHIADALDIQIQRLSELFAMTNQTGVIMRKETDGMPVMSEAFARVKLG